jgi:hypothetical protein
MHLNTTDQDKHVSSHHRLSDLKLSPNGHRLSHRSHGHSLPKRDSSQHKTHAHLNHTVLRHQTRGNSKKGFTKENDYIRTLENNQLVRDAWPGFIEAVQDFNAKTGRQGWA